MLHRPEERHEVDFQVFLTWQEKNGVARRTAVRCTDLSASGARVESRDRIEAGTAMAVHSEAFGRMGNAGVRYCRREGMKYLIGLRFNTFFGIADPARREILASVSRAAS